jgi:N-acyl homoserine lactone hydrolase
MRTCSLDDRIRDAETFEIDQDEYDVFGDGSVILKSAPGHTPGHATTA